MKKKVLSVLLAVCLLVGCVPVMAQAEGATFTLGESVTTPIAAADDSTALGEFTAPQAGWYRFTVVVPIQFCNKGISWGLNLTKNGEYLPNYNRSFSRTSVKWNESAFAYLEAGDTVSLKLYGFSVASFSSGAYCVATVYAVPAENIGTFSEGAYTFTATPDTSDPDTSDKGGKTRILEYTAPETGWYEATADKDVLYHPDIWEPRVDIWWDSCAYMTADRTYYIFLDGNTSSETKETVTASMKKMTVPAISLGEHSQSDFSGENGDYWLASFTPAVSGRYKFTAARSNESTCLNGIDIFDDAAGKYVNGFFNLTNIGLRATSSAILTGGVTYTIMLCITGTDLGERPAFTFSAAQEIAPAAEEIFSEANSYGLLRFAREMPQNGTITRLDLAMILASAAGVTVDLNDTPILSFSDCDSLTNEQKSVLKACKDADLMQGFENGSFQPQKSVTKAEAAGLIEKLNTIRAATATGTNSYTDVTSEAWYYAAVTKLLNLGITPDTDTFSPHAAATRADVLEWLVRACNLRYLNKPYVRLTPVKTSYTVRAGESTRIDSFYLSHMGYYSSWSPNVSWFIRDPEIANFPNHDGTMIGRKAGSTIITYMADNGTFATSMVRVTSSGSSSTPSDPVEDEPLVETDVTESGNVVTTTTQPNGDKDLKLETPAGETIAEIKLPADPGKGKEFADVKPGAWYKNAVDKATAYGLFGGESETMFAPNGTMTRAMLAQVLYNLSGRTSYGLGSGTFTDVKPDAWYKDAVDWAAKVGVTSGTGDGGFSPNQSITREQLVTMLYNYAKVIGMDTTTSAGLDGFPDSEKVSRWAAAPMQWAVAKGFINGRANDSVNYIAPQGTATRAEVAAVLVKFTESL